MTLDELRKSSISTVKQIYQQWLDKAVAGGMTEQERELFVEIQKIYKTKQEQEYI